jgi:hypothetical protein
VNIDTLLVSPFQLPTGFAHFFLVSKTTNSLNKTMPAYRSLVVPVLYFASSRLLACLFAVAFSPAWAVDSHLGNPK